MKPKQLCQFCEKKFKRVKGHYAFCKVRNAAPISPVNESLAQEKTPAIDINRIQERAFRSGLVSAIEAILREIR